MNQMPAADLQELADSIPAAAFVVDNDYRLVAINMNAETLFGTSRATAQGSRIKDTAADSWLKPVLGEGEVVSDRDSSLMIDDRSFLVHVDATPLRTPDGSIGGALVVVKAPSAVDEAERRMRQLETLAGIGEIAAGTIHEIRNPLTSISGFVQLLKARAARQKDQTSVDYCTLIAEEINHIDMIMSDFLALSKPQEYKRTRIDLVQVIQDALKLLYGEAVLSRVSISSRLPAGPLWISGSREKIKEVLINICRNAFQAMPHGGTLTITASGDHASARVVVADTGAGIPEAIIGDIFKPFFTTKSAGTGLGLAICRRVMAEHRGEITAANSTDGGAVFTLAFPRLADT